MGNDRPEDRAARVEKVVETGNLDQAMEALRNEVQGLGQDERLAVFKALEAQNKAANDKSWSLPNVTIDEKTTGWFGYGDKTGEVEVKMNQNLAEQGAMGISNAVDSVNPFKKVADALDQAANPGKKKS